jgi:HPt (histidine-containing phosphotransfer) domain-containing protein
MDAEAFKAELQKLNAEYRSALPGKLADIDALWARLSASHVPGAGAMDAGAMNNAALADLHRLLHTLAGSAKTFGLAPVSVAAREAEHALDPCIAAGSAPNAAERVRIAALLEALRRCAAAP